MPHAFTCACAHPLTAWLLSPHYAPGTVRGLRQHRPGRGPSRETAPNSGRVGRRSAGAKREPSKRHPVGVAGVLPLVPFHFPPSVTESPTAVCPTSTLTIQSRSPGVQQPGTEQSGGGGGLEKEGGSRRAGGPRGPPTGRDGEPSVPLLSPSQPCRLDTASHQAEEDGQKLHSSARAAGTKHQGPCGLNKGNLFLTGLEGEVQGPGASGQQRRRPRVLPRSSLCARLCLLPASYKDASRGLWARPGDLG